MTAFLSEREAFARLVRALEPYLDDLVYVGGWAHRLYGFHELASLVDFEPLATDDADLAAPLRLPVRQETLAQRLKDAGFSEEFRGEDSPPITEYHLGAEDSGLYVEFLAPLLGGPTRKDGTPKDTTLVAGVTAQTLRYIDVLLASTWKVRVSNRLGFPVGDDGVELRIANPACFIAQKLLVLDRRSPEKRPKDVLYVHDTLALFSERIASLRLAWENARRDFHPNVERDVRRLVKQRFGGVDDLVRGAARIAERSGRPSPPTPERLAKICLAGAWSVFGED